MLRRLDSREDDGSILLSFLAMIAISGLLLVVAGVTINGQQQTRFDRTFEQALQVAEVGQGQMVSLIQSQPESGSFAPMTGTTSDGGSYAVDAVKDGFFWTVRSTGTASNGRVRRTEIQVGVRPLFSLAAFGRTALIMNGGNGADSFDSALGTDICKSYISTDYIDPGVPTNVLTANTDAKVCKRTMGGSVATNGRLFLKGGVEDEVDRYEIHNAARMDGGAEPPGVLDPLPGATGVCDGNAKTCDGFSGPNPKGKYFREPIELPAVNQCDAQETASVPYNGDSATAGQVKLGGERYFFTDATLTGKSLFTGTIDKPTILCVSGNLTIQSQNLVNFRCTNVAEPPSALTYAPGATCSGAGRWVPRRPGSLLIFLSGESSGSVTMGNSASVSAAIFAPNAAVECGPQGNVYGSLVANSINNAGGWNFHYDDALAAQSANAAVRVQNWRELD